MGIEDQLRERLRKVEALFFGAATAGEREAAGAAAERLKAKLDQGRRFDPPIELKFTVPDQWSARLFIALCRRYGFTPYRYSRQRHTTVMVKDALWTFLEQTTERVIRETIHADAADAETAPEPLGLK